MTNIKNDWPVYMIRGIGDLKQFDDQSPIIYKLVINIELVI